MPELWAQGPCINSSDFANSESCLQGSRRIGCVSLVIRDRTKTLSKKPSLVFAFVIA